MPPRFEEEQSLSPTAAGLVELARDSAGHMADGQRIAGLQAVRARLSRRHRSRNLRRAALALTGAAALAGYVVVTVPWGTHRGDPPSSLALRVEGAELRADGAVEASGSSRPVLRFSDGSEITLAEGALARVRSMDPHGARVSLELGEAHVYVVHAQGTRWSFDAGPFVVAVTGTAFVLSWRGEAQRLDVRLESGAVSVSGPASDAPLALRAGQWLTVQRGDVRIRGLDAGDEGEASAAGGLTADASATVELLPGVTPSDWRDAAVGLAIPERGSSAHRNAPRAASEHDWAGDLARGRFKAIVADAVALRLDEVFAQSSAEELAALADAARYTLRPDIGRGALLAQRRRFPTSDLARAAAFDLGRMEEADQNPRAALAWFDTYLAEAPNGRYASEALGRKMTLVKRLEGKEAARSWADLYLRRFPNGTYAAAARAVTGGP